jgi:hypothetical protein
MTDISELIERVRLATGSDRKLDVDILVATGWVLEKRGMDRKTWLYDEGGRRYDPGPYAAYGLAPRLTASIDAALALVERMRPGSWRLLLMKALHDINKAPDLLDMSHMPRLILLALLTALQSTHSGQMK